jgi:stage II sporulation protein M
LENERPKSVFSFLFGAQADFVKRIIPLFMLNLLMFSFSIFTGFYLGDNVNPNVFEGVFSNIPDPSETDFLGLLSAISMNNITASLIFIISGLIIGIPPLLFIAFNGFFVGWIVYSVSREMGLGFVVATMLPHGIIEIPTITFSAAMGMGLGYQLIHQLRKKGGIKEYLLDSANLFIKRIVPFLLVAAIIETYLIMVFS